MKIVDMYIYGFGQLENVKIEDVNEFQVFYGENEAGKSTIMAFIHGILFGFPSKVQNELRYEPKHHAKYGGKLRIFSPDYGFVTVERVKGKIFAGDVTVIMDNGTVGGEELLKQLLSSIDKGLFQAIFSFNLQGLQNIHQMKKEEIGKFLFSAGALGSERLSYTENELQKELEVRFKPGGKKPLLNEKLISLHQLNEKLKKASAKNQEYKNLIHKKEDLQNEMMKIQSSLHQYQQRMNKLNEWKKIEPFVVEGEWIERQLKSIGPLSFPTKGIEKMEKLNQVMPTYKAQISSYTERLENLKTELENVKPDHVILENESEIQRLLDQLPLYEELDLQLKQEEAKLLELNEKLEGIKEKLHSSLSDEEFLDLNTNLFMKNQVNELSQQGKVLKETKENLDCQFSEEKRVLEDLEDSVRNIESQIIPDYERQELDGQLKKKAERRNLELELKMVREKLALYKKVEEQEKKHAINLKKQMQNVFFIFSILFLGAAFLGWFFHQYLFLLISILCLISTCIVFYKGKKTSKRASFHQELSKLQEEEQWLIQEMRSVESNPDLLEVQTRLAFDNRLREELQVLKIKVEQQNIQYEKVISKFEGWEEEARNYKESLEQISIQLCIPLNIANTFLLEAFHLIEQYKNIAKDKKYLLERIGNIKAKREKIDLAFQSLKDRFLPEQDQLDRNHQSFLLRKRLKEEKEKSVYYKEKLLKQSEVTSDLEYLRQEMMFIEDEMKKLFEEALVQNEQQFFEIGEKIQKRESFVARLDDIKKQLNSTYLSRLERRSYLEIHDCDEIISEHEEQIKLLKTHLTELQEQHASLKMEIQLLEEGGQYSELLHQFKEKKYDVDTGAKEWAVYSIAQDILSKTIEKYKNIHLPKMLAKAEEFLSYLTDGQYVKIIPQQTGSGFLIERKDYTLFEANELSQATTEQVYVSIRLALAATLYEKFHFPIIIDDSFVNFDIKRTEKIINLLKQLKNNQVLFFTCHAHLLTYFQKNHIHCLNKPTIHAK